MQNSESRQTKIEILAGEGNTAKLKELLEPSFSQIEVDTALENAIAYSQIKTAEYLLSLGAKFSNYQYQSVYYAVHNNELKGLRFAISNGVDINVNYGMLLNTAIITAINTKSVYLVEWLLNNGAKPNLLTKRSLKVVREFGNDELKSVIKNVT